MRYCYYMHVDVKSPQNTQTIHTSTLFYIKTPNSLAILTELAITVKYNHFVHTAGSEVLE